MRNIHITLMLVLSLQIVYTQEYKVSVFEDNYIELDTFESIILEDGNHLGWEKRFELNFNFPYYDTTFNYIFGNSESLYSFENELDYSIRLMTFGYEFDKLSDPENVPSDLRYALTTKNNKKSLCLQYTKNRLTSDPSVEQYDSYINFQIWFIENGDIEVRFGDYNLVNSPVYVPNEGFYLQTVNQGPIIIGPVFGLYHPYKEGIIFGINGQYDSLEILDQDGYLTLLPPPNWVIKFEKQSTSIHENLIKEFSVYPNPFIDRINFTEPFSKISIFSLEGKLMKEFESSTNQIDLSNLLNGMYIVKGFYKGNQIKNIIIKQ